jgi:hypothetical protein
MKSNDLALLIGEIKNGGPSPLIDGQPEPLPILFKDEMEQTAGKVTTSVFGEPALATLVTTSYRIQLLLRRGGKDLCHSYWYRVNFGSWRWQEPDGFIVAGIETSCPEFPEHKTNKNGPPATWQTYFISPEGERRLLYEAVVNLTQYHHHQEKRFADWKEVVSPSGDPEKAQPAIVFFGYKLMLVKKSPGIVDLEALWQLSTDPLEAAKGSGGNIPEESPFHPSKATRMTEKIAVSKVTKGTSHARKVKKVLKSAISAGSQVKGAVETAQKAAGVVSSFSGVAGKGAAATAGEMGRGLAQGVTLCVKCGAPLRAGALFCGRCGHHLGEAIIEEIKDQAKGKVEDAVVERIEQALETDEDAGKGEDMAKKSSQKTSKKTPKKKVSTSKSSPAGRACPNCATSVKAEWKFCPQCMQALPLNCPQCGQEIQAGWKFCPHCSAKLEGD